VEKILIIDYEINNTGSIINSLEYLGVKYEVTSNPNIIKNFKKIILPGVGSFKSAMNFLQKKKLDLAICDAVLNKKVKILGICLGMQLLGQSSTEFGYSKGLGLIKSKAISWINNKKNFSKNIHIGFNSVNKNNKSLLFYNIKNNSDFYFVHSYYMTFDTLDYGIKSYSFFNNKFLSAFEYKNIFATQFHPEKSQKNGLKLLNNFCNL
jgi:glutamine amidotransferase